MSNETFKVGEIAIFISSNLDETTEYHLTEVEIISPLMLVGARRRGTGALLPPEPRHRIRLHDGRTEVRPPRYLRKRPPKQDWKRICNLTDVPREVANV